MNFYQVISPEITIVYLVRIETYNYVPMVKYLIVKNEYWTGFFACAMYHRSVSDPTCSLPSLMRPNVLGSVFPLP